MVRTVFVAYDDAGQMIGVHETRDAAADTARRATGYALAVAAREAIVVDGRVFLLATLAGHPAALDKPLR